jgi:hypothetical protein
VAEPLIVAATAPLVQRRSNGPLRSKMPYSNARGTPDGRVASRLGFPGRVRLGATLAYHFRYRHTIAEERIRRQRGREKPSTDVIGMRHQRASNWGLGGLIVAAVLLSPVLAFLMALVVDIVIGFLNDGSVPALLVLVAAGAIGGFLFRTLRMRPQDSGPDWT